MTRKTIINLVSSDESSEGLISIYLADIDVDELPTLEDLAKVLFSSNAIEKNQESCINQVKLIANLSCNFEEC